MEKKIDVLLVKQFVVYDANFDYVAAEVIRPTVLLHMPTRNSLLELREEKTFYIHELKQIEESGVIHLLSKRKYLDRDFEELEKEVYVYLNNGWTLNSIIERKRE